MNNNPKNRGFSPLPLAVLALVVTSCGFMAAKFPSFVRPVDGVQDVTLPPGFKIEVYVDRIEGARSLALSPGGTLFVGSRGPGKVRAVVTGRDGKKEVVTLAEGLSDPNGVAFKNGSLFVAEISRVIRFDNIEQHLRPGATFTPVNNGFPSDRHHGQKFIGFGPDGKLYVPVGAPCNTCERDDPRYMTIMRMNADGTDLEIYASGVRNSMGFDWNPADNVLWFTDNGRDMLGDDIPPDELNVAPKKGMHFGFPYLYGKNVQDDTYKKVDTKNYTPTELDFGAHVAALGMRFYTGKMFPQKYRGGIFVAQHGSWNRSVPDGYRVMFVPIKDGKAGAPEIFASGFLKGAVSWGRPVDVQEMPDGSLLVSDDKAGAIYRITYEGNQ